eukprot:scaffold114320_cov17-Tisochrysis_lutea.AAC.1
MEARCAGGAAEKRTGRPMKGATTLHGCTITSCSCRWAAAQADLGHAVQLEVQQKKGQQAAREGEGTDITGLQGSSADAELQMVDPSTLNNLGGRLHHHQCPLANSVNAPTSTIECKLHFPLAKDSIKGQGRSDLTSACLNYLQQRMCLTAGNAEVALGRYNEARSHFAAAALQRGSGIELLAQANLALVSFEVGNEAAAVREVRQILRKDPNFLDMRAALTAFLYGSGKKSNRLCLICFHIESLAAPFCLAASM